jgi:cbb3-type cytochrome oxidase subunit 3
MDRFIQELILFVISFFIVFLLYRIFVIRKAKSKKKAKEPFEVTYLVNKYKLDLKKVNYKRLLNVISVVSSFDIALIVTIILLFKNFYLEMIMGFVSTLIIILVSYHLVYLVYKKKGMIIDEHKRNRK